MPSTHVAPQASRSTIWLFRSLALGSTFAVAINLGPIMEATAVQNALTLSEHDEEMIAKSGAKRIKSNANASKKRRNMLIEQDAICRLASCVAKKEAWDALIPLIKHEDAKKKLANCQLWWDRLADDKCDEKCEKVWKELVGVEQVDKEERIRLLNLWGEQVMEKDISEL